MKFTMKRSLACLLVAVLLMTILPLSAIAAPTYSWTGNELKESTEVIRFSHDDVGFTTKYDGYLRLTLDNKALDGSSFQAFRFATIAAGVYTVQFDTINISKAYEYTFHVFPVSLIPEGANASTTTATVTNIVSSGEYKVGNYSAQKSSAELSFSVSAELSADTVFVIAGPATGGVKTYMDITKLSLTKTGDATTTPSTPAATEPAATEPSTTPATTPSTTPATTPATNAPTTPADNAGADNGGFPVAAIVAIVVVVLGGAAAGVYFFLKKKKAA